MLPHTEVLLIGAGTTFYADLLIFILFHQSIMVVHLFHATQLIQFQAAISTCCTWIIKLQGLHSGFHVFCNNQSKGKKTDQELDSHRKIEDFKDREALFAGKFPGESLSENMGPYMIKEHDVETSIPPWWNRNHVTYQIRFVQCTEEIIFLKPGRTLQPPRTTKTPETLATKWSYGLHQIAACKATCAVFDPILKMKHVIFWGVKMAKIPTPRLVSYSRWQGFFPRISSGRVKPRSGGCVLHQGWKRSFCGTHTKRSPQWSCHSRNHFGLAEEKVNKTCLNLAGQRPLYISLLCIWYKYEYMVLQLCWYQSYEITSLYDKGDFPASISGKSLDCA